MSTEVIGVDLPLWAQILVAALVFGGSLIALMGSVGLLRLKSYFERVHAPAIIATLGCWCILLGALANQHGDQGRWQFGAGAVLASLTWFFLLAYGARALRPLFARPLAWRVLDGSIATVMWTIAFGLTQTP